MSQKRGGLGRNLSALLSQPAVQVQPNLSQPNPSIEGQTQVLSLPIMSLTPGQYQPRRTFSAATISELADSIRQQGLLQPLVVRELQTDQYEIIAGERRWRACQQLGMTEVPVVIRQVNDETAVALALIENLQREDLSALEQARAMHRLLTDFGLSHQKIAELLSKSRTAVTNHLRLLNLSTEVQAFLEKGSLDMGHARCLLTLSEKEQKRIANLVVAKGLSVRETERLVHAVKTPKSKISRPSHSPALLSQITQLGQHLHTDVRIKANDADRGTIVIHYTDQSALDQIISKILG